MEIVIAGVGKVGITLAKQLSAEKHNVTVIDINSQIVDNIVNVYDVMGVCGNCASYEVQMEAQVPRADLLIAATSSDEVNIITCLVAKKLGVSHTIARVRNPEYEKQLRFMWEELGLSMSINPERATAREIARVLRFPNAIKLEPFCRGRLELVEYRLEADTVLDNVKLSELYRRSHVKVLICAVSRDGQTIIPSGDFVLRANDKIYITAAPHELEAFFRYLGVFRNKASSVIIVGASKICYYLAQELLSMDMSIKIIDIDERRCLQISEQLPGALVITGDGADSELLQEEGIENTDAFVAITGMDEANILMSMNACKLTSCKAVVKINRTSLLELVAQESMIDSVVSTGTVTEELILQYIRGMQNASGTRIRTLHRLIQGTVEALEFGITDDVPFIGVPLKELTLKNGILIAGIVRQNGRIVIPSGDDALQLNDDVIVVTTNTALQDIRDIVQ